MSGQTFALATGRITKREAAAYGALRAVLASRSDLNKLYSASGYGYGEMIEIRVDEMEIRRMEECDALMNLAWTDVKQTLKTFKRIIDDRISVRWYE